MAHSPSKVWENGVLVERALATNAPGEPNESEATTSKPYKTPVPTPQSADEREELRRRLEADTKAVSEKAAENKAVKAKAAKKK